MDFVYLLILATIGGVFSLAGGLLLLRNKKLANIISHIASPFAAGALLAAVFFDLLPEALEIDDKGSILLWVLAGIVGFFLLERRLGWFHHHHEHEKDQNIKHRLPAMLVVGDTVHNAIDGVAIGIAFLANPGLGVVTALAVALHEIPQEIADFGLLLKAGWKKSKIIKVNILSALASVIAAVAVYLIGIDMEKIIAPALALVSGMLLYIALSDVLPTVHETKSGRKWFDNSALLVILGIVIVWGAVVLTHNVFNTHSLDGAEEHRDETTEIHD